MSSNETDNMSTAERTPSTGTVPEDRSAQITYILSQLKGLKRDDHPLTNAYAIEQNLRFFEAIRTVPSYVKWLIHSHSIKPDDLLEINEILPDLDHIMHAKLSEVERRPFPGIARPVVECLLRLVQISKDSRIRIASLGSGAAEAERQFVTTLLSGDQVRNVTIMTIDTSELAHTLVAQTFNETHDPRVTIVRENVVSRDVLLRLEREHKTPVLIVQCQNDIFDLSREFQPRDFTVVMTMLFLHHLDNDGVIKLMEIMSVLGRYSLNYDGLRSDIHLLPQTLTGWSHPVFLNAVVFSNLRFATKQNIKRRHAGSSLRFYSHGHYLALNEQR